MLNIQPEQFDFAAGRAVVRSSGVQEFRSSGVQESDYGLLITDYRLPITDPPITSHLSLLTSHKKDGPFLPASRG